MISHLLGYPSLSACLSAGSMSLKTFANWNVLFAGDDRLESDVRPYTMLAIWMVVSLSVLILSV